MFLPGDVVLREGLCISCIQIQIELIFFINGKFDVFYILLGIKYGHTWLHRLFTFCVARLLFLVCKSLNPLILSNCVCLSGVILHEEHIELRSEEYKQLKREVEGKTLQEGTLHFTGKRQEVKSVFLNKIISLGFKIKSCFHQQNVTQGREYFEDLQRMN